MNIVREKKRQRWSKNCVHIYILNFKYQFIGKMYNEINMKLNKCPLNRSHRTYSILYGLNVNQNQGNVIKETLSESRNCNIYYKNTSTSKLLINLCWFREDEPIFW